MPDQRAARRRAKITMHFVSCKQRMHMPDAPLCSSPRLKRPHPDHHGRHSSDRQRTPSAHNNSCSDAVTCIALGGCTAQRLHAACRKVRQSYSKLKSKELLAAATVLQAFGGVEMQYRVGVLVHARQASHCVPPTALARAHRWLDHSGGIKTIISEAYARKTKFARGRCLQQRSRRADHWHGLPTNLPYS